VGEGATAKTSARSAREQLLQIVSHQAHAQGKSVAQYLREIAADTRARGKRERAVPRPGTPQSAREKYTYLTRIEVEQFFRQVTDVRDRAMFGVMYYFGLRSSEVGRLLREHVNLNTRRIYISRVKSGVPGEKVMTSDCRRLLQRYLQQRRDSLPYLFPSRNARPISRQRLDALFRRYARQAGVPLHKRHCHCLRHAIATHLLDAGQSLEYVQDHLGHRTIQSTQVYAKISDAKRERVAAQLELSADIARVKPQPRRRGRS
jgi:integrase